MLQQKASSDGVRQAAWSKAFPRRGAVTEKVLHSVFACWVSPAHRTMIIYEAWLWHFHENWDAFHWMILFCKHSWSKRLMLSSLQQHCKNEYPDIMDGWWGWSWGWGWETATSLRSSSELMERRFLICSSGSQTLCHTSSKLIWNLIQCVMLWMLWFLSLKACSQPVHRNISVAFLLFLTYIAPASSMIG